MFTEGDAEVFGGENPAAWNLGIAATAIGDWDAARRASRSYGIDQIPDATRLGFAGDERALSGALDEWLDTHRHVVLLDLELLW